MVDFRFDIRPLFPQPIVKVTSNLLPHTFRGDRRQALDATSKMSEIIDRLGQLSAASQKLTIPITTGQRLRQSENQTIYILADTEVEPRGVAVGLLKVGKKDLYLFDETGQTRKIESAPCILDFYIHESRQRAGLGLELFQTMLSEENWKPVKCSIDRPSDKLLAFMRKHYGLERTIPQANNFVLYEGFFDDANNGKTSSMSSSSNYKTQANGLHITNSINTQLFGAVHLGEDNRRQRSSRQPDIISQVTQVTPTGRYGAKRPVCSMGENDESDASLASSKATIKSTNDSKKSSKNVGNGVGGVGNWKGQGASFGNQSALHTTLERRSGLQEVDENYLSQNIFAKPIVRHTHSKGKMAPVRLQAGSTDQSKNKENSSKDANGVPDQKRTDKDIIQHVGPTDKKDINNHSRPMADDEIASVTSEFQKLQTQQNFLERARSSSAAAVANEDDEAAEDAQSTTSVMGDDDDAENAALDEADFADVHQQQQQQQQDEINSNGRSNFGGAKTPDSFISASGNNIKRPGTFHLSKQHTGMKNISFGVGMAVTPSNKMEFDQENREDFGIVKINRPLGKLKSPPPDADAMSTVSSSGEGLTDQGYYDLKFYHNKLW